MSRTAVVLLSGGQDSTTCLFWAKRRFDKLTALSFDYGQRHSTELGAACSIAKLAEVEHVVLPLNVLAALGSSALVNHAEALTAGGGFEDEAAPGGLPSSFVPGRNLLFLTVAAALAVKQGAKDIVAGVCQTDYSGYPDCRRMFIDAAQRALTLAMPSSAGPLVIHTPLMDLSKAETVVLARRMGIDCWAALGRSVTCYEGRRPGCGDCPACVLRSRGFKEAGLSDPSHERSSNDHRLR